MNKESLAVQSYLRIRAKFVLTDKNRASRAKIDETASQPFSAGRDPMQLSDALGRLSREHGWTISLGQALVFADWPMIVGMEIANKAHPVQIKDGILLVQCASTAWVAQLKLLKPNILHKLATEYPNAAIETIKLLQPDSVNWKKGYRTVPGRGPRDTYG